MPSDINPPPNPYWSAPMQGWFWYDETFCDYGSYATQREALRDLLAYCRWLEIGPRPPIWKRLRYELRRLWNDTRG